MRYVLIIFILPYCFPLYAAQLGLRGHHVMQVTTDKFDNERIYFLRDGKSYSAAIDDVITYSDDTIFSLNIHNKAMQGTLSKAAGSDVWSAALPHTKASIKPRHWAVIIATPQNNPISEAPRIHPVEKPADPVAIAPIGDAPKEGDINRKFTRESTILSEDKEIYYETALSYSRQIAGFGGEYNRSFVNNHDIRVGLAPWWEASVSLPFVYNSLSDKRRAGIGDAGLNMRLRVLNETSNLPTMFVNAGVILPTASKAPDFAAFDDIALGGGQYRASLGTSFVKNFDPAVIFGGLGYSQTLADRIENADIANAYSVNYSLGLGVGLNPNLSISTSFQGAYNYSKIDGFDGFESEPASMRTGVNIALPGRSYIEPSVSYGLNDEAADITVGLAYGTSLGNF